MDEADLVGALKNGDSAALESLVETHGTRLLRSAMLLCGNETHAQDLVQETFVQAVRSIRRFRGQAGLYKRGTSTFSRAVVLESRLKFWKMKPMRWLRT